MKLFDLRLVKAAACAGLVGAVGACSLAPAAKSPAPLTMSQIDAIVASPDRSAADRENDVRRKPAQILAFIGVRPGMVALDVVAGGGYTTELLARAIGPGGMVHGQARPRDPASSAPAGARPPGAAVAERAERLRSAQVAAAPIAVALQPLTDPVPAALAQGQLDLVTLMFNYHDLGFLGAGRAQMNRSIFQALKPGGLYVIADHSGRPGTGISESTTLHRIEEAFLRSEVEAAGFKLVASGEFLRNPADPRDKETPDPPQPKDEFILKFVKPAAGS
ncbi:class I SAM-dependent methyltransferase [Ideonella sp. YS5]|uniref:class I SAM-dependent methyltransferase n=1 Tax=Ideonella sp. YS5 TaxID=3453714 RepID=UPI003EE94AE9